YLFTSIFLSTVISLVFFSTLRPPPPSPLFPYTTLFRSAIGSPIPGFTSTAPLSPGPPAPPTPAAALSAAASSRTFSRRSTTIVRSEEHTSELQSRSDLVCRLLLEKKKKNNTLHMH